MNETEKEIEKQLLWKLSKIENVNLNHVKNNMLYFHIITTHKTIDTVTDELTNCVASWSKLQQSVPKPKKPLLYRIRNSFLVCYSKNCNNEEKYDY